MQGALQGSGPTAQDQEHTKEELKETLRITLQEALELYRQTAREAAGEGYEEEAITLSGDDELCPC